MAIVTGADIARRLASDGLAVAVADRDEPACQAVVEEIEAAGGRGLAVRVDVSDEQAVQDGVEQIVTQLGEPTVLVNNAGIIRDNLLFRMTVNRPGSGGGSQSMEDESHGSTQEVPRRAA
ncbi:SDR family NAD(P)-dependent oxidoreductase [Nocardioides ferulae]|uniref:SDR family NAD(P)-dependent oxidoreductase n=1 Tax=Nocardioides ferulae TaxID=2340821 RepID=UPI001F0C0777|nr:SDR family NAD(P)-dependent oxidoreductase [Nocardioides ferulae]